jgi:hypothetical protein
MKNYTVSANSSASDGASSIKALQMHPLGIENAIAFGAISIVIDLAGEISPSPQTPMVC